MDLSGLKLTDKEITYLFDRNIDWSAEADMVLAQIAEYEVKHGMSTEEMRRRVVADEMPETAEVLQWLMAHNRYRDMPIHD